MIADIRGKISRSGSNLSERLEDNLTGNVFGSLRYIPFSIVMKELLVYATFSEFVSQDIHSINCDFWADKIQFWPYDAEGEIDALIEFDNLMIGIEVKYLSGLSSDDDISNNENNESNSSEMEKSIQQLARESRILAKKGRDKKKLLLFVADRNACQEVYEDTKGRNILEKDVVLGYLSWQDLLIRLKELHIEDPYHQVIVKDVIGLLIRKGFEDFSDMLVHVPQPIHYTDYFQFNAKNKTNINFEAKLSINGGMYYDFI